MTAPLLAPLVGALRKTRSVAFRSNYGLPARNAVALPEILRPETPTLEAGQDRCRLGASSTGGHFQTQSCSRGSLSELAIATLATVGVLLVVAMVYTILQHLGGLPTFQLSFVDNYDLTAEAKKCDACKKVFYLGLYVAVPLAVFLALRFLKASPPAWLAASAAILGIFVVHYALSTPLEARSGFGPAVLLLAVTAIPSAVAYRMPWRQSLEPAPAAVRGHSLTVGLWDAAAIFALALLLLPADLEVVASNSGAEGHKVSYFIGPALYGYESGLVPGLDFHTHYGPLLGPVFHALMGSTWKSASMNAVGLNIVLTFVFYTQAYFLLRYLTGSQGLAIFSIAAIALLNFSTPHHFYSPSAYPTRFPLLIAFAVSFAWYCRDRSAAPLMAMSACTGLSLLWHTEVGIYMMLAGLASIAVSQTMGPKPVMDGAVFAALSVALCALASLALYGPRTLSIAYYREALAPTLFYGSGWGSVPLRWEAGWSYLYNLPLQLIGALTVGWAWHRLQQRDSDPSEREIVGILLALSLLGLALMVKWVNRSLDAVWHQNALPLLAVALFWVRLMWRRITLPRMTRIGIALSAAALVFAGLATVQDSRNPHLYGLRSYVRHASLAKAIVSPGQLREGLRDWDPELTKIAADDIALIHSVAKPGERVLIASPVDWAYLAQAHRPPKAVFLPLLMAFDERFVAASFEGADAVLLDKNISSYLGWAPSPLVMKIVERDFARRGESASLILYQRR
jgi:hypothetical protein